VSYSLCFSFHNKCLYCILGTPSYALQVPLQIYLTHCRRCVWLVVVHLEQLMCIHLNNKFLICMLPGSSSPLSHRVIMRSHLELDAPSPHFHTLFKMHFNNIPPTPRIPKRSPRLRYSAWGFVSFIVASVRATCPSILHFLTTTVLGKSKGEVIPVLF
jgi:hypothetical protein